MSPTPDTLSSSREPVAWAKQVIATGEIGPVTEDPGMRDYWIEKHVHDVRPPYVPTVRVVPLYLVPPGVLTCLKAQGHAGPHSVRAISLADLGGEACGIPERDPVLDAACAERRGAEQMREAIARAFACTGVTNYDFARQRGGFIPLRERCGVCADCKWAAAIQDMPWRPARPLAGTVAYCTEPLMTLERRYCGLSRGHTGPHAERRFVRLTSTAGSPDA